MKILYNKLELYPKWFMDNDEDNNFTDKIPVHAGQQWNEELNDWVLKLIETIDLSIEEPENEG